MTAARCRFCLALEAACEANRLYGSRPCCSECDHPLTSRANGVKAAPALKLATAKAPGSQGSERVLLLRALTCLRRHGIPLPATPQPKGTP